MARSRKSKVELVAQTAPDAPIDSAVLLARAQPVLAMLTDDLLKRADGSAAITRALKERHKSEKANDLTADSYAVWRRQIVVQIAAGWLLSCVFVRVLEDRGLLATNRIAGEGALGSQHSFFQIAPFLSERDYLLTVFRELEHYPAARALFDREHNLAWRLAPSAEAAKQLLGLFREPSVEAPAFRFGQADTRFLGDLYQDLSEDVRKRYALLQTPDFIEAFILDRTLEPAIEEFGLEDTDLIDPTCGSGHFLLGAFDRLYERWVARGVTPEEAVEKALGAVYGVDVNPYAVSIARFRLTLAAFEKLGVRSVKQAPALNCNLAVADSLLHNYTHVQTDFSDLRNQDLASWHGDIFLLSDPVSAKRALTRTYAAVVGNPPYITVKNKGLRDTYRKLYSTAHREYSLAVPFMQRFFQLGRKSGFVGQITANSFMKREFGKKLIEDYLVDLDLELLVNASGAYVPGHGTPTVLVFGRNRAPQGSTLRAVLARRGEPSVPADPSQGLVWSSIRSHWDDSGFENEYITVDDLERRGLNTHPWSLEGGGAAEVKAHLEANAHKRLGDLTQSIGFMCITKQDDVFSQPIGAFERNGVEDDILRAFVIGEHIRDWSVNSDQSVFFPYNENVEPRELHPASKAYRFLWHFRTTLESRAVFGGRTFREAGRAWHEYGQIPTDRQQGWSIAFAFVATHNHFVIDQGGQIFNRSAPIIKLAEAATEDDHYALLAYLNSSTACFWMKQVAHDKGSGTDSGKWQDDPAKIAYEFTGTHLQHLPIPDLSMLREEMVRASRTMSSLAQRRAALAHEVLVSVVDRGEDGDTVLAREAAIDLSLKERMIRWQEFIDWSVYSAFSLVESNPVPPPSEASQLALGSRPFERRAARGGAAIGTDGQALQAESAGADDGWVETCASLTDASRALENIESPNFKRRFAVTPKQMAGRVRTFADLVKGTVDTYLATKVEEDLRSTQPVAVPRSQFLHRDSRASVFVELLKLSSWSSCRSIESALTQILEQFAVPYLATVRFTEMGWDKYRVWRKVWDAQRTEDRGGPSPTIVPPSYRREDYANKNYWELRGKLDVPKERFIAYPGCESDRDNEPVYGWAGWDHAQRAKALAGLYVARKDDEGWPAERLQPMLAGLLELLPWVKQWHPEPDPDTGEPFGNFLEQWLEGECRTHGLSFDDLRAWRPATKTGRKKSAKKKAASKKSPRKTKAKATEGAS